MSGSNTPWEDTSKDGGPAGTVAGVAGLESNYPCKSQDRYEIAWRIWCWRQGYGDPEDRAILTNWLREDESKLHPHDIEDRDDVLSIADEVIALAKGE